MAINTPQINYTNRTFLSARQELINYVRAYYPTEGTDFTESSLGILLIELMSVGVDILSYHTDSSFQETQLSYAKQRKSVLEIAKTMGLNVQGKKASVTIVDFTVTVPTKGDTFSDDYLPVIQTGTQVIGGGKVFETLNDIDFASDVSNNGFKNRIIIPNVNINDVVQSYTLTKREIVYNGTTKIFVKNITPNEYKPFYQLTLPDTDVVSVESIINLAGFNNPVANIPLSSYYNDNFRFYEVDYLMQDRVFVEDKSNVGIGTVKAAKWQMITKKFIKEFTDKGFCKLTFGNGNPNANLFKNAMTAGYFNGLDNYLENTSLGEIPSMNSQIIVKYRTGGGSDSNIGANVLTTTGNVNMTINGPEDTVNQQVRRSLKVNNPVLAIGGSDVLDIETIRNLIKYNFASQDRCITLNDYLVTTYKMPSKFGSAFRLNTHKENNKVVISILGLNSDGKLENQSTSILKENISEYLSQKRAINDYVEIKDGKIYNLACEFDLYIDENIPSNEIALNTINTISNYFNINSNDMNVDIYLGNLIEQVNNVTGVINILDYRFYNKISNGYSVNEIEQPYLNETTREINLINNTLYSSLDSMFEIKYPNKDIKLFLKKKNQLIG